MNFRNICSLRPTAATPAAAAAAAGGEAAQSPDSFHNPIIPIILQNRGELRRIKLSPSALTDPAFYRWCAWFALNGLWPGRDERNHAAQRNLGAYSIECLGRLKVVGCS